MGEPIFHSYISPSTVESTTDCSAESRLADPAEVFVQHHLILNHGLLEFSVVDVLTAGAEAAGHHLLASLDTTFGSLELIGGLRLTLVD